jgi:hypothetical protein
MTNVSITRGCDQDPAEQFIEGAITYARVCGPAGSRLVLYSEERCILVVKVDGSETLRTIIEANQNYEFRCCDILKAKRGPAQLAKAGFMALIGNGSKPSKPAEEELASEFLVEIRQTKTGAPLDGSYHYHMLSDEAFDQRFAGYMSARVVDEPKPIFTRDARPIECLANNTKCLACGTVITDCIAGCENVECPTLTDSISLKADGTGGSGNTNAKPAR